MTTSKPAQPAKSNSKRGAEAAAATAAPEVVASDEWHLDYEETAKPEASHLTRLVMSLILTLLLLSGLAVWLLT